MTSNLKKAKSLLLKGNTCALVSEGETVVSAERGVTPLLRLLDGGKDFSQFFAADKVVGKAAAALYVRLKVAGVYAEVISKSAVKVFQKYGVSYSFGKITDAIANRKGDGICPMELAVTEIDDAVKMELAVRETARRLGVYGN